MSKPRSHADTHASPPATDVRRRRFILALGAGGAGVAAAATPVTAPIEAATPPAQDAGGYRLTDHIRDYYATARL